MDRADIINIVRVLSTAYLFKRNGNFPNEAEINLEIQRREKWIGEIFKNLPGEAGFKRSVVEIWKDPPENFSL